MADSPYPELKKSHTMAQQGRPWSDVKPPPSAPVWGVIFGLGSYWLLLAALELGLFESLREAGPQSAQDLATSLESSAEHTEAVADALVVLGFLELHKGRYQLNDCARRYLCRDGAASMSDLIGVAPGPLANWERMAETVRAGAPSAPVEDDMAAFYGPLVEGTFTTVLRAATRAESRLGYGRLRNPRVLDLGAGAAPWSIAVLTACTAATAVVNDLPEVLALARREMSERGLLGRCEFLPGDFHSVAIPDNSFDVVVLGHVCRTEGQAGARSLIRRAAGALRPGGLIWVADYFRSAEPTRSPHAVLMRAVMMAATRHGTVFTYSEFAGWLREAGFEDLRLIEPIPAQQLFVARLKTSAD